MNDFSLFYLTANRLLDEYYEAMVLKSPHKAYEIAIDLIEIIHKLEEIAHDSSSIKSC